MGFELFIFCCVFKAKTDALSPTDYEGGKDKPGGFRITTLSSHDPDYLTVVHHVTQHHSAGQRLPTLFALRA